MLTTADGTNLTFDAAVTGVVWQWSETQMSDDTVVTPNNPEDYYLAFHRTAPLLGRSLQPRAFGSYTTDGSQITMMLATTRMHCGDDSQDTAYALNLAPGHQLCDPRWQAGAGDADGRWYRYLRARFSTSRRRQIVSTLSVGGVLAARVPLDFDWNHFVDQESSRHFGTRDEERVASGLAPSGQIFAHDHDVPGHRRATASRRRTGSGDSSRVAAIDRPATRRSTHRRVHWSKNAAIQVSVGGQRLRRLTGVDAGNRPRILLDFRSRKKELLAIRQRDVSRDCIVGNGRSSASSMRCKSAGVSGFRVLQGRERQR
ncbi:MAG: META domain-containing protein [Thermomicrobiales bacterium]